MRHSILSALTVAPIALCAVPGATAQEEACRCPIQTLRVETRRSASEFNVIEARMDETATATVLFGAVGAVANSVRNNIEDKQKAAVLQETAVAIDRNTLINQALIDRLKSGAATLQTTLRGRLTPLPLNLATAR